jgi:hypothetical protein
MKILIGVLLVLHGVIHAILAVIPNPNSDQPEAATFFALWASPWLTERISGRTLKTLAIVLAVVAGIGFIASGLAVLEVVLPHGWWRTLAIGSSAVSLLLCLLFWNRYLVVGPVVALGIIVGVGILGWPSEAMVGY